MNEHRFKTVDPDTGMYVDQRMDKAGNHFENGVCVNPLRSDLVLCDDGVHRHAEIGESYPETGTDIYPSVIVTGYVELPEPKTNDR